MELNDCKFMADDGEGIECVRVRITHDIRVVNDSLQPHIAFRVTHPCEVGVESKEDILFIDGYESIDAIRRYCEMVLAHIDRAEKRGQR